MTTAIAQEKYKKLEKRQAKLEAELIFLKEMIWADDEKFIRPVVLKKWERISRDMDHGKGRFFSSVSRMKTWLKSV